jgi:hypothetical protein
VQHREQKEEENKNKEEEEEDVDFEFSGIFQSFFLLILFIVQRAG